VRSNYDVMRSETACAIYRLTTLGYELSRGCPSRTMYSDFMMNVLEKCTGVRRILKDVEELALLERSHALEADGDE
jgi:hypothetical protein